MLATPARKSEPHQGTQGTGNEMPYGLKDDCQGLLWTPMRSLERGPGKAEARTGDSEGLWAGAVSVSTRLAAGVQGGVVLE